MHKNLLNQDYSEFVKTYNSYHTKVSDIFLKILKMRDKNPNVYIEDITDEKDQEDSQRRLVRAEKKAQRALEATEIRYRAIVNNVPGILWSVSQQGILLLLDGQGAEMLGIDILIGPNFREHRVLEFNAFGDLLPGVLWEGMNTYEAQVAACLSRLPPAD